MSPTPLPDRAQRLYTLLTEKPQLSTATNSTLAVELGCSTRLIKIAIAELRIAQLLTRTVVEPTPEVPSGRILTVAVNR